MCQKCQSIQVENLLKFSAFGVISLGYSSHTVSDYGQFLWVFKCIFCTFLMHFVLQNRKLMPKFVLKEMESLYIEEMNQAISTLKSNLESLPVQLGNDNEKDKKAFPFPKIKAK